MRSFASVPNGVACQQATQMIHDKPCNARVIARNHFQDLLLLMRAMPPVLIRVLCQQATKMMHDKTCYAGVIANGHLYE